MRESLCCTVNVRNSKFFRLTLLTSNNDEIEELLNSYDRQSKALKKQLLKMCWYMRGSISIEQMYELGFSDREMINKLIDENLEITKDTHLPFF